MPAKPKRTIVVADRKGGAIRELELVGVASVSLSSGKEFLYLENNGKGWRMTYTDTLVPDIKQLGALLIRREEGADVP